jgi:hypothetical protein
MVELGAFTGFFRVFTSSPTAPTMISGLAIRIVRGDEAKPPVFSIGWRLCCIGLICLRPIADRAAWRAADLIAAAHTKYATITLTYQFMSHHVASITLAS